MTEFAAYCFNRSHSAAYAMLAYQTAYLKAHYPVEYMSALLSSVSNDQDRIQIYIAECQKLGIEVLPPDVNSSCADFTPDGNNIRFGLASVKNVGLGVVEAIVKAREDSSFTSFFDFCTKVDLKCLNKRTLESLIRAGAFTGIEKSRKQVLENLESALNTAIKQQEAKANGQMNLFSALSSDDSSSIPVFALTGSDEEFSDSVIQGFEKELLGFYVTSHPLSSIKDHLPFLTTHNVSELHELPEGAVITVCGLISSVRLITTKTNKLLKVGTIEDLTGNVGFVAYSEVLNEYNSLLETEAKVILAGKTQFRGDEETTVSIILNSVKPVDNCNIVNLYFNEDCKFEDIVAVKDLLLQHKGSDPIILNVGSNGNKLKMLAASNYWVQTTNELQNKITSQFRDKVSLSIKSLDVN
ncbi:MAG TPA: hypothetical protein DDX14_09855 [Cyanobacteria bacterium UBA9579]|nr:hypothetical protein [Cyanobacteria bacterium UBA9579]